MLIWGLIDHASCFMWFLIRNSWFWYDIQVIKESIMLFAISWSCYMLKVFGAISKWSFLFNLVNWGTTSVPGMSHLSQSPETLLIQPEKCYKLWKRNRNYSCVIVVPKLIFLHMFKYLQQKNLYSFFVFCGHVPSWFVINQLCLCFGFNILIIAKSSIKNIEK